MTGPQIALLLGLWRAASGRELGQGFAEVIYVLEPRRDGQTGAVIGQSNPFAAGKDRGQIGFGFLADTGFVSDGLVHRRDHIFIAKPAFGLFQQEVASQPADRGTSRDDEEELTYMKMKR